VGGAAYDGLWAARAMDAAFAGRLDDWRAAVEASGDALILAHLTRA
jgi:hypothetical protein